MDSNVGNEMIPPFIPPETAWLGRFSFLSQQKANQNQRYAILRSPPVVIGGLDLQYQKVIKNSLPRWYNYLVWGSVPLVGKIRRKQNYEKS